MAWTAEERVPVATPPDRLWGLLVEPRSWTSWWPTVRDARSLDYRPLREGSRFEVTLDLGRLKSTLRARVVLCAEAKGLTWTSSWLGAACRQEWYLEPQPDGSRFIARTTLSGPVAPVLDLLRVTRLWQTMLRRQARGLKQMGERLL